MLIMLAKDDASTLCTFIVRFSAICLSPNHPCYLYHRGCQLDYTYYVVNYTYYVGKGSIVVVVVVMMTMIMLSVSEDDRKSERVTSGLSRERDPGVER